jgi:pimeloyl-ACP methyl ester carboxylesterase
VIIPSAARDLILIHGAWQGSWAWDYVTPLLAERGLRANALDLPGNGADTTLPSQTSFDLHVNFIADRIKAAPSPVWVVAHSGGGAAASQAVEVAAENVAGIVYVCGFMVPDGVAYSSLVDEAAKADPAARGIWPYLVKSADGETTSVPADAALEIFYHDCPPDLAKAAAARLTPQPERTRMAVPRLSAARFGRLPRVYIEALRDRSVVLALQRRMQDLSPGARRFSLDSGHAPLISQPGNLVAAIAAGIAQPAAA